MATQAVPILDATQFEKTWGNFDLNNVHNEGNSTNNAKRFMYDLKEWLKTLSGMSVRDSNLSTPISGAGVDLLTSWGVIVTGGGGNRSWIVLEHTSGYQICISSQAADQILVAIAPLGAMTAGTTSVAPTSSGRVITQIISCSTAQQVWSAGAASDGKCWWFAMFRANAILAHLGMFEGYKVNAVADTSDYAVISSAAGAFSCIVAGAVVGMNVVAPTYGGNPPAQTMAALGGNWWSGQMGLVSGFTPILARVIDCFLIGTGTFIAGDRLIAADAGYDLVVLAPGYAVPWDGASVLQKV